MKSILFVYHASNIGGGTYCLLNILKEIDRSKYNPIVLLRSKGDLVKEIKDLGIDVLYMPTMTLVPYNRSYWERGVLKAYWNIKKSFPMFESLLERINPDAVYFNTMMLAPYLEVAKKKGLKTAIHLREHWSLNEHVKQLFKVQNIITTYADQIIAINSYSASMVPKRDVTIVYDWIDLSNRYAYQPFDSIFGEGGSRFKVYMFLGGLQDIKGAAEVVEVFSNHIKGDMNRLLMVGVDPKPNYKGLKNKIRYYLAKTGLFYVYEYKVRSMIASDDRIVCIPAIYELKHIIQQAYCNISFFTIPHANLALAESIILGTISVAAKTEESVEYSNGGDLALLFELGNKNDFIEKIKELDKNYYELNDKLAKDGHVVAELFDKKRNVAILEDVLNNLVENK